MNMKKPLLLIALAFFLIPATASAAVCSWSESSVRKYDSTVYVYFKCKDGNKVVASKTVINRAMFGNSCSIFVNNGYKNIGNCERPNIVINQNCPIPGAFWGDALESELPGYDDDIREYCGGSFCDYRTEWVYHEPNLDEDIFEVYCK